MNQDLKKIRDDFPILNQKVHNKPLIYFDNAATTQKPRQVIETINNYHNKFNSTIHRGLHFLSEHATDAYEKARHTVKEFINAPKVEEIIFTSGTTASINTIAFSFGEKYIQEGDEIILSEMEHHANIVPWQMLCERKKARLRIIPFNDDGELVFDEYVKLFNEKTRLVSITYVSNILGTINDIKKYIDHAHQHNVPVLIDAAQAVQHKKIDVVKLDCDFLAFSGHKLYGPTGIGVLYGKEKWLDDLPPYMGGGDMIEKVTFEKTSYTRLPFKFEAGTTNYIGAIGMAEAINYVKNIGIEKIAEYENQLRDSLLSELTNIDGIRIFGKADNRISLISFLLNGAHFLDVGMILDKFGIAVRTGSHCGHPVMQHYGITGNVRASVVFYNTKDEIEIFIQAVKKAKEMLV
ncbi:aminotransferase class V-fold PLP-dependent enzyme [Bacteroidota bacterium]